AGAARAQDADRTVFETEDWGVAPYRCEVRASSSGWVASLSAGVVGQVVVDLGGGRRRKEDAVDPAVGVEIGVEVGDRVEGGQTWGTVLAATEAQAAAAAEALQRALVLSAEPVSPRPVVLKID
ncbi:MAG: pyrimidine-nucleoside phosphorylase, partial [Fimbriimonadaceae bacterium]